MNIDELKRHIYIPDLEPLNSMKPAYISADKSQRHYAYCPHCGTGTDRLHTFYRDGISLYTCNHCGANGNAVQFYAAVHGLTLSDAVHNLSNDSSTHFFSVPQKTQPYQQTTDKTATITGQDKKDWIQTADDILKQAQSYIWTDHQDAQQARQYLHGRGITDDSIKGTGIGYRPYSVAQTSGCCKQYGILIPTYSADHTIQRIKIRYLPNPSGKKYAEVKGSQSSVLFGADILSNIGDDLTNRDLIITEGELDAIIMRQAVQRMELNAVVVSFGSVGHIPTDLKPYLSAFFFPRRVYVGLDNDSAGDTATAQLCANLRTIRDSRPISDGGTILPIILTPHYKDWTEWWTADNIDLMTWLWDNLSGTG